MSSTSTNDVTGDKIQTKNVSETYRNNFDLIFRKPMLKSNQDQLMENQDEIQKTSD